jgi:hypothetical protein
VTALFALEGELVVNGDFGGGSEAWELAVSGGAAASGSVADGAYQLQTQTVGSETWSIQFMQAGMPLVNGTQYKLEFTASASAAGAIRVNVGQAASPWTSYLANTFTADLTTTPKTFTLVFTMNAADDADSRLEFNTGLADIDWTLDNVSLREAAGTTVLDRTAGSFKVHGLRVMGRKLAFSLPQADRIALDLLDMQGKVVRRLGAGQFSAGSHTLSLADRQITGGAYVIALKGSRGTLLQRVVAVK